MIPLKLAKAQSEDDVTQIIESSSIFNRGCWKPLGFDNNYGVILNQQAHPVASLVEKIINSSDALLIKECRKRGIDPESPEAPKSMFDAVESFYNIKDGKLSNLSRSEEKELSKNIRLIADGEKPNPNIIVADLGEGQHPEDFEDTFLTILKGEKSRKRFIPFVQGMFYMGGTGVLPNCGENGYELIISKKAPELQEDGKSKEWGWTIIRKNSDKKRYEYFVDENELIPTFDEEIFQILENGESIPYGTFMKMYNYKMETKSNITADLMKKLNIFLFRAPLPVQLIETRDFGSLVMDIVLKGNEYAIEKSRDKLETSFIIEDKLGELEIRKLRVFVFKNDLKPKENFYTTDKESIFLTINGQTHATLGRSFIRTRAAKTRLSKSLLVEIDCTDIAGTLQDDAFMPSRDRLRDNEITKQIINDLSRILKNDETLRQIDSDRYEKLIEKSVDDSEFANKIVGKLIQNNRNLIKYLKLGGNLTHPSAPGQKKATPKFDDFPTYLRIKGWKRSKGDYYKEVPIDSINSKIEFELDAPDDYFDRDWASGELIIDPQECFRGRKLRNGILRLKLSPIKNAKIGDEHLVKIEVTRHNNTSLFVEFNIKYTKPVLPIEPKEKRKHEIKPPELRELGLPVPHLVKREDWEKHGWSGEDVVKIEARVNGNTPISDLKIFINMDNDDLISFKRRGNYFSKMVNAIDKTYEISVILYSLTSYIELLDRKRGLNENNNEFEPDEIVPIIMRGISKTMLDMVWNPIIRDVLKED